ncbi:quinone-dependent dihydroorotate dehydrogenase [Sneathiella sp. P13V-1]|uniref:quinone-dependent dihydroorotate dehydrogenase n=1 Tax=Sneathiella sp. P13V-1 TaxID=2697366 RepID=UPI00187B4F58|nr:quinone-dependent dihydroorotate dehydrogenase [Sneathiella sp. P13V-1]MBE7636469.1 quinone-dependent dihydroorotate dehydrogenase [Sneathiella sp. P13V-1]
MYKLLSRALFLMDPEKAHGLSIKGLQSGLMKAVPADVDPVLNISRFGLDFPNPIGLSAGFDKNGDVLDSLLGLGFGFVEAGSVTPRAQDGNPKPRVFRLEEDKAVINRLGFNNRGLQAAISNFSKPRRSGIVGANLGANKTSEDRIGDYVKGLEALSPFSDYVTVNISSPNTPGLRALQGRGELEELLGRLMEARKNLPREREQNIPLLLKIAPDLTGEDKEDIATVAKSTNLDGLIINNTTITRPDSLRSGQKTETGGLSGAPLKPIAQELMADMYKLTGGDIPLVGVGGIASAEDAYARIRAGASLIQFYSAMVYEGPYLAHHMAKGLAGLLKRDGYSSVEDAIGVDVKL